MMKNKKYLISIILFFFTCYLQAQELTWHNPMSEAQPVLHGQGWQKELKGSYHRIPDRLQDKVSKSVWSLSSNTAGENLVFRTNSATIKIRYGTTSKSFSMRHMPATGVSGIDLYAVDEHGTWSICNPNFQYSFNDTCKYTFQDLTYPASCKEKGYEFHLYLPLYNGVQWLEIGVENGSTFRYELPSLEKPIVIYGTSIAQGACASRPGMAWTNIVERSLQHPILNLGFSGSANMESGMQEVLNELDPSLFILDNMENMSPENVYESSLSCCRLIRKNHPDTPILLVEHSGQPDILIRKKSSETVQSLNTELKKVFATLQEENMQDIFYLTCEEIGLDTESFVEGIHPNDWGMVKNAKAVIKKIKEIFQENATDLFKPCTQNRDPYMWRERHEQELKLNDQEKPDIVFIGNSITHYFGGEPKAHIIRGQEAWEKMCNGKKIHNLGFGWDRLENGLWRIYHGELDGYEAEKIFLLLGTNNVVKNTDAEIVEGMMEVLQAVKERQPKAKIYQCGIMPRAGWGARVQHINKLLQEQLEAYKDVTYISFDDMGDKNGELLKPYQKDGTHPNAAGYEKEAEILSPYIK